ncbi:MAG: hypothetical protein U5K77_03345 [Candidatus Saccharibacteria bacterium]|nr:hypothetical protein [Candidatus Saccharibacteria bacterium]
MSASSKKPTIGNKETKKRATTKSRKLAAPTYRSFKISKPIKHPNGSLPSSLKLLKWSLAHILAHKKVFIGITAVYLLLTVVFVKGFGVGGDVTELRGVVDELLAGSGRLFTGLTLYGLLVGSTGNASSGIAGLYQTILLIMVSLALIWALRQTYAKEPIRIRDAFYKGMYPLVPFILVLAVVGLQLLPAIIGGAFYSIVVSGGLAVTGAEQVIWLLVLGLLILLSLYMVSSSLFALYIVTLPDMTPMSALRSARELVRYRRWSLMRKIMVLPFILLISAAVIMVPLLLTVTLIAEYIFFIGTMFALAVVHSYMYTLYRELL